MLFQDSDDNFRSGFNDWAHGLRSIHRHKQSKQHSDAVQCYFGKVTLKGKIDIHLKQQLEDEKRYWREVLRRVVECLKFLCSRGLALRGDSDEIGDFSNGNFLGALEFLAKFDPFLAKHLESQVNQGRGNVSYISSTSYEEIVFLMAKKVLDSISSKIATAKYFSLVVNSSTDTSHCDQLAIIIRYVSEEAVVEERFIGFESSCGHSGKAMADAIKKTLDKLGLNIKDARGRSYNNASNMSGKYKSLQALLKNENPNIEFIPCAGHSLNLVGVNAVDSCEAASDFFGFLQSLYNFCTSSTHRWQIVCSGLVGGAGKDRKVTIKSLSGTRWSARTISTKVLHSNYNHILENQLFWIKMKNVRHKTKPLHF